MMNHFHCAALSLVRSITRRRCSMPLHHIWLAPSRCKPLGQLIHTIMVHLSSKSRDIKQVEHHFRQKLGLSSSQGINTLPSPAAAPSGPHHPNHSSTNTSLILMPDTATATTTTATTTNMALSSSPNSRSSTPESNLSHSTIPPFIPGQCLFCLHLSSSFLDGIEHMQKSHGLFIPHRQLFSTENLEALFEQLHLIIFEYHECIKCGTTRSSVQAMQQHMTGKPGHCTFDISDPESEFAELYRGILEGRETDGQKGDQESTSNPWNQARAVQVDEDSLRLPSGRIISKKSSVMPPSPSATNASRLRHNRTRVSAAAAEIGYAMGEESSDNEEEPVQPSNSETTPGAQVVLSKREKKRARDMEAYQLTRMSANDRTSLMHLPVSQQRALLATQQRHQEKMQTEERRQRAKIDRKGNKNLYTYWNTETPVYLCG